MIAQKCPCVNNAPQNAGFCALSPSFPPLRALFRPHLAFRHRTLFASFALLIAPSALRRTLFRLRHTLCSPAFCPALLRTLPRRPDVGQGGYAEFPAAAPPLRCPEGYAGFPAATSPPRFAPALHISSKEQNPCARGAGVSSHCHVMFRRRLTPRRGRCKPAHRRRASWLQARSQASTHSG